MAIRDGLLQMIEDAGVPYVPMYLFENLIS